MKNTSRNLLSLFAFEVGNSANLILVSRNPLEYVSTIREPLGVMAAGQWYSAEALAKLIEIPGSTK